MGKEFFAKEFVKEANYFFFVKEFVKEVSVGRIY